MRRINYKGLVFYVTEEGKVFGPTKKERKIQTNKHRQGRQYINTSKGTIFVHTLIAMGFPEICGEMFEGCEVHHLDGDCSNNHASNLKVLSKSEHWLNHKGYLVQENTDGVIIGKYTSSLEAEKQTGISSAAIRVCLSGKSKTSGGFYWYREKDELVA